MTRVTCRLFSRIFHTGWYEQEKGFPIFWGAFLQDEQKTEWNFGERSKASEDTSVAIFVKKM